MASGEWPRQAHAADRRRRHAGDRQRTRCGLPTETDVRVARFDTDVTCPNGTHLAVAAGRAEA